MKTRSNVDNQQTGRELDKACCQLAITTFDREHQAAWPVRESRIENIGRIAGLKKLVRTGNTCREK